MLYGGFGEFLPEMEVNWCMVRRLISMNDISSRKLSLEGIKAYFLKYPNIDNS